MTSSDVNEVDKKILDDKTKTKQDKKAALHAAKQEYRDTLYNLQVELVKLQKHLIEENDRILLIFEGRDTAGKDGVIKRISEHLSPRETRIVALGKPSDRELSSWYFQRYTAHLPSVHEMVLFNRSWYNRAGVERVMGFCTDAQYEEFMETVPLYEQMLTRSGIKIVKYYLDIKKGEQKKRLADRHHNPLKQWKVSPIDEVSLRHWNDYSAARNEMFARTHHVSAPWYVVNANNKRISRLQVIKHILTQLDYNGKDRALVLPDPDIVFEYNEEALHSKKIAP